MERPLFIGDEVTAAGYRLAGLEIRTPSPQDAQQALEQAGTHFPPLVLLTAEYAQQVAPDALDRILGQAHPPVHLVEDAGGRVAVPDLAARIRSRVGVAG
ncbi:hypothetical protein [Thiohalorhabdus sp.]|uniref:hypothetical protein n=1 Tax=Thiohalorhabdus sp. TaxID=3094134 RepID=UPI002FC306F9